jgi:phage recombination protein Bet
MSAVIESKPVAAQHVSLLAKVASRYSVEPAKMLATLKATAFKGDVSNEQMMALLIVADQYGLNPWTKEVYAFPDKNNGIVPVVGVDGWSRIINTHPEFDGLEFVDGPGDGKGMPEWIECVIHRKDRAHPIRAREYMGECKRGTGPWQSHPRRMLRHKALIQCARLAFGYTGIYDQDEAERIVEGEVRVVSNDAVDALNAQIRPAPAEAVTIDADQSAGLDAATEMPTQAPRVTYAELVDQIHKATDVDSLDALGDLIQYLPEDQQPDVSNEFGRRRKQLVAKE